MTAASHLEARVRAKVNLTSPIPLPMSRSEFPQMFRELGFTTGAEIGVWKGAYSASLCKANPALHLLCVDPWLSYPAWLDTKNAMPKPQADRFMADAYATAQATLAGLSCTVLRSFSTDAARAVPDGSLDFVYIDANHTRAAVLEDLAAWVPKVRMGGIVAGHDYRIFTNKPTIHVVEAVQAYTQTHDIGTWYVTAADRTPSFLWVVT